MKSFKENKGFTLIEILIVIAVIIIVSGTFWASLRSFSPSLKLSGAARDIATDLRYAQELAVDTQIEHGVVFASSSKSYRIVEHSNPDKIISEKTLPSDIGFHSLEGLSGGEARFNPYGASNISAEIELINSESEIKTIEIRPSGFVKVLD